MPGGAGHNRGASKQNFATPRVFGSAVLNYLGIDQFAHDFAAEASNAVATCYWDEETDAHSKTVEEWQLACTPPDLPDPWGWLNPPFDDIEPWAAALAAVYQIGGQCAFLVPAAVGSNWWRDYVHNRAFVLLLNGRIPFDPEKPHWGYPKDMTLCLFSPKREAGYAVWRWWDAVDEDVLKDHKARCTEARLVEKNQKAGR